jgi:molybdenum ABC transporter molybdate-binding protein
MLRLFLAVVCTVATIGSTMADDLRVLAAGSLRDAIGEIGDRYKQATGTAVAADFSSSGLLRERIETGEKTDLFASADMGNPLKLLADGRAIRVDMFTRNTLCAFAAPRVGLTDANFIDRLLDPAVKLGTSTPKNDPSGDFTWLMFHKVDTIHPGAYAMLDRKAQKIVGRRGPVSGDPVTDGFKSGTLDVMIGYCSGRERLVKTVPDVEAVAVPQQITAGPEYGLAILKDADLRAEDLALYMLSPEAQQIFANHGFTPVGLPTPDPQ